MPMTLAELRRLSGFYLTLFLWFHVPLSGAIHLFGGAGGIFVPACVALLAAAAQIEYRRNPTGKGAALTFAIAFAVVVALMVFQLRGSAWQTDLHMYFFAVFAMMSVFCDWRPIVAFAGVVAVHHLGLNFVMTSAVFPGESDLGRVILHAAVLITQAVVMLGLNLVLARMFGATEAALAAAEESREVTDRLNAQRDAVEQEQRYALRVIETAMNDLARGDLQARVQGTADDPFPEAYGVLRISFNTVAETFSQTIGTFEANAREMLETADRIAEAADATSRGVENQKTTLTGSANSLRQITQSVAVTSDLAVKAEDEMQANRAASEEGGSVLLSAVAAMGRIEKSSGEIHRIVEVIEDIAFQTNLLALNAGVEAGRAGDAGKGFAVVATEVRALAQRASASAKDIRKRIEESRAFVAEGCVLVEQTSEALSKVIDRTANVAGIMSEINQRVSQQTADLRSIMSDVSVIERDSQLAAQEAESSREIAERISGQADHLIRTLEVFALPVAVTEPGYMRLAG